MRPKSKKRTTVRLNLAGADVQMEMIFAHRPSPCFGAAASSAPGYQSVRGALPGSNTGEMV
jgi:hypothetical protein